MVRQWRPVHHSLLALLALLALLLPAAARAQTTPPASPQPSPSASPRHARGFIPQTESPLPQLVQPPFFGRLLSAVDLSDHLPPQARNQGRESSCVAWAIAYAIETYHEQRRIGWPLTEGARALDDHLFSPAFLYNVLSNGRDEGLYIKPTLEYLKKNGVATWSEMPYADGNLATPSPAVLISAQAHVIDTFARIGADLTAIRSSLAAGIPVVMGAEIDDSWDTMAPGKAWSAFDGSPRSKHAFAVVGYDDTFKVDDGTRGALKFMNSWGQEWGTGGFGWLAYSALPKAATNEVYIVKGVPKATFGAPLPFDALASRIGIQTTAAQYFQTLGPGWLLDVQGSVNVPAGATGNLRVVVRFYIDAGFGGGQVLRGAAVRGKTYDYNITPDGYAAAYSIPTSISSAGLTNVTWDASITVDALDLPHGQRVTANGILGLPILYHVVAEPTLYIDDFPLRTAPAISVPVNL